jgi:hypothetical protein
MHCRALRFRSSLVVRDNDQDCGRLSRWPVFWKAKFMPECFPGPVEEHNQGDDLNGPKFDAVDDPVWVESASAHTISSSRLKEIVIEKYAPISRICYAYRLLGFRQNLERS